MTTKLLLFFFLIHLSICTFYAFNIVLAESLRRSIYLHEKYTQVWAVKEKEYCLHTIHNSHCSTSMKRPNRGEVPNNYCGRTGVFIIKYYVCIGAHPLQCIHIIINEIGFGYTYF